MWLFKNGVQPKKRSILCGGLSMCSCILCGLAAGSQRSGCEDGRFYVWKFIHPACWLKFSFAVSFLSARVHPLSLLKVLSCFQSPPFLILLTSPHLRLPRFSPFISAHQRLILIQSHLTTYTLVPAFPSLCFSVHEKDFLKM